MQATRLRQFLTNKTTLLLAIGFALAACNQTYNDSDKSGFDKTIRAYVAKKGLKMERKFSGLYVAVKEKGTGDELIQSESVLKLAYKGTLLNGTIFDQTEPGKPFKSPVTGLIRGFQEALIGQTEGVKLHLIIPPQLGYGDAASEKIPANSVLVFELEVVEVR